MFHNRSLNNQINNLQERALRFVYKDHSSSFAQLLDKDNSFSIHERNLQKLAVEMHKVKNKLSPSFIHSIFFTTVGNYNLRKNPDFKSEKIQTTTYGSETLKYHGTKIWDLVPEEIKVCRSLKEFKYKIKKWKPDGCKVFIHSLGFI